MINVNLCLAKSGKPIGTMVLGGFPGNYHLKQGLTGPTLADGSRDEILRALALVMADQPDNYTPPTYGEGVESG